MAEAAKLSDAAGWPRCDEIFWNEMTWPGSSTVALPLLTTAIWYWERRTGRVLCATVYVCVCLCVSDSPCDVVRWLWPPGTPRQPPGTGMWWRLKDLSHLKPSSSSSSATPPVSVSVPESYAPQVDDFKAYCKPKATRKESKMCNTDKSEGGFFFLADDKSITFRSIRRTCKHRRVYSFKICSLLLSFSNGCCGCEALVNLVLVFYVWMTTFLNKLLLFYGVSCWLSQTTFRLTVFPINDSQGCINCGASIRIKSTSSCLHACLWLRYLLERLLYNSLIQKALKMHFLYKLLNKGFVSSLVKSAFDIA